MLKYQKVKSKLDFLIFMAYNNIVTINFDNGNFDFNIKIYYTIGSTTNQVLFVNYLIMIH